MASREEIAQALAGSRTRILPHVTPTSAFFRELPTSPALGVLSIVAGRASFWSYFALISALVSSEDDAASVVSRLGATAQYGEPPGEFMDWARDAGFEPESVMAAGRVLHAALVPEAFTAAATIGVLLDECLRNAKTDEEVQYCITRYAERAMGAAAATAGA